MSTASVEDEATRAPVAACAACHTELAPGLLACPGCRKLVHADRLKVLATEAGAAEQEGRIADALSRWREALALLPAESKQHGAVGASIRRLGAMLDGGAPARPAAKLGGTKGVAGAGAAGLVLWKLKFFFLGLLGQGKILLSGLASLPTLLSMVAWVVLDRSRGASFAFWLMVSIYVHEMGHVAALQRYGIKATAPMFVPGFGALVRLREYPADAREDARVGLAGPVWGCAAAAVALGAGFALHQRTLLVVASLSAMINVFNLIPFWQLDGARGFRALDSRQRMIVVGLAALCALLLAQPMCWIVCVVGAARLKSDLPAERDARAFWTFALLLVVLSLIARCVPAAPG